MKIAIVGLGKIADYHLNAINKIGGLDIVGGFDIDQKLFSKIPSGKHYKSYAEILADPDVETVLMLVPSDKKFELCIEAISAGKALLTEKPASRGVKELRVLRSLVVEKGVMFYCIFHSMFSPTVIELQRLLASGTYTPKDIINVEIWADSPHIKMPEREFVSRSSETTSFQAEGANILAELSNYFQIEEVTITKSINAYESMGLPEVHTEMHGFLHGNIPFMGTTSWIRNRKEKGIRITFKDGRQITAVHTEQRIYTETGAVIFDATLQNPETSRMQKEYLNFYRFFYNLLKNPKLIKENLEINLGLMSLVAEISEMVSREIKVDLGNIPQEGTLK